MKRPVNSEFIRNLQPITNQGEIVKLDQLCFFYFLVKYLRIYYLEIIKKYKKQLILFK